MVSRSIRIGFVDDDSDFLDSICGQLDTETDLDVVCTATGLTEGLRNFLSAKPEIALLDVDFAEGMSFEFAADIRTRLKDTKVVFLTAYLTDTFVDQAIKVKAHGYLLKTEPSGVLIDCIKRVALGEMCFSQQVQDRLVFDPKKRFYRIDSSSRLTSLTVRQLAVLRHLAEGYSVKEVAYRMHLSPTSVHNQTSRIMKKLGIHDRVRLTRFAIREGLLRP